jgi:hypothetical protein
MTEIRYLRADDWGIRWARPPVAEKLLDEETYVHHTGGGVVPDDAVVAFRWLNEYAINTKGYSALDYDLLVHRDPRSGLITVGGGREGWLSAATLDRNEQGEAVCLLGNFEPGNNAASRRPHPDELEGVAQAITWGIELGWISPATVILGHRDNPAHPNATACPGLWLYEQLSTIRRRVAEILAAPIPPPPPSNHTGGDRAVRYFKLGTDLLTCWATSDGLNAVRLEPYVFDQRVAAGLLDPAKIPVLPESERGLYVYHAGLTYLSVR